MVTVSPRAAHAQHTPSTVSHHAVRSPAGLRLCTALLRPLRRQAILAGLSKPPNGRLVARHVRPVDEDSTRGQRLTEPRRGVGDDGNAARKGLHSGPAPRFVAGRHDEDPGSGVDVVPHLVAIHVLHHFDVRELVKRDLFVVPAFDCQEGRVRHARR